MFLNDPDTASSASRQHCIETGSYMTYREVWEEVAPHPLVTVAPLRNVGMLGRLFYDDVEILAQYEDEDKIVVLWHRRGDGFRESYQRDRLGSALMPTYSTASGLHLLEMEWSL